MNEVERLGLIALIGLAAVIVMFLRLPTATWADILLNIILFIVIIFVIGITTAIAQKKCQQTKQEIK